jgi:DNA polymerase-3 subunit epsilon
MSLDLILITDTETTGFRHSDLVVEVAMILYSLVHAAPVTTFSTLIPVKTPPPSSIGGMTAEEVHGIPQSLLDLSTALENSPASAVLHDLMDRAGAVLAHSATFDKRMLKQAGTIDKGLVDEKKWVCTLANIHWPNKYGSKSLVSIALAHGVPVISAHRALTDCDTIARLLTKVHELGYDLVELVEQAMEPHITVKAMVSKADKDQAQSRGFYFRNDPPRWLKIVPEAAFKGGALGFPFECIQVPDED